MKRERLIAKMRKIMDRMGWTSNDEWYKNPQDVSWVDALDERWISRCSRAGTLITPKANEVGNPNCPNCNMGDIHTRLITKGCGCERPSNKQHSAWTCGNCCKEFEVEKTWKKEKQNNMAYCEYCEMPEHECACDECRFCDWCDKAHDSLEKRSYCKCSELEYIADEIEALEESK